MANNKWKWYETPYAPKSINPTTGAAWTFEEFKSAAETYSTAHPHTPTNYPTTGEEVIAAGYEEWAPTGEGWAEGEFPPWMEPPAPNAPGAVHPALTATTPTFGAGAGAEIPTPKVTPAPPYEKSEAQIAFEDMYGGKLTDWVESGGYGIPEETQNLMIQKQTDSLKARETENIRVMRNNMERRGITNSGFVFANEQNIRSNTSVAIAGAIADVQIKSALMKMSSFEKAMGQAGQFLGYLSEQSQLQYQPEFATWQAEQMTKMQVWQGKLDVYKMELNQAYQTQNILLQGQIQSDYAKQQHGYDVELAQMEIDYAQEAAKAEAGGSISGSVVTGLFALGAAFI